MVSVIAAGGLVQMSVAPEHGRAVGAGALDVQVQAPFHQLGLQLRRDHVRLDHGIHVLLVDFDDVVHPSQVQEDDARGEHARPAGADRPELQLVLVAQLDDRLNFRGVLRKDYRGELSRVIRRHY